MKILFNTMGLGKGGAERVINLLSNEFVKTNEVMIVTNINSKIEYIFDNKVIIKCLAKSNNQFTRKLNRISVSLIVKLRRIILSYNPDIIISFLPEPSFRLLLLKKFDRKIKKIPVIVSVRNDPNTEYNKKLYFRIMKELYPNCNQLVLQTEEAKKYFIQKINYDGVVIPNPVSDDFLIKKYKGERDKRIVAVGRLENQKNYYNMLNAFKIVNEKIDGYSFDIYGDGYLKEKLQEKINQLGLNNIVKLNGKVDNVKDKIYKAKVFVMSSDYEGMPNSLLEAACIGVPCVSTDCPCGGPREILDNGNSGCLVPVNNPEKLADGIIKLINDIEYANRISDNANNNSTKYSKKEIIKQWKEIINKTIKESEK